MQTIIITGAGLARELLRNGERLIDIKPHRQIKNASVFVFEATDTLRILLEDRQDEKKKN